MKVAEARTISAATKTVSAALSDMTIDVSERKTVTIHAGPVKYKDMDAYRAKESKTRL